MKDAGRNAAILPSLRRQWLLAVLLYGVSGLAAYLLLAALAPARRLEPWLGGTGLLLAGQLWLLRRHLGSNRSGATRRLYPGLGAANAVTLARGFLIGALGGLACLGPPPVPHPWAPGLLYAAALAGDLLDGTLARRTGRATELGRILDYELDAFGVLAAAVLAVRLGRLPSWFMLAGAAHYLFLLYGWGLRRLGRPAVALPSGPFTRYAGAGMMVFLAAALLPLLPGSILAAAGAAVAAPFCAGFLWAGWRLAAPRFPRPGPGRRRGRMRLRTLEVGDRAAVREFFDRLAAKYRDTHGDPDRLLADRVAILRWAGGFSRSDRVLEIGCGTGDHLAALAPFVGSGVGVDVSPPMIRAARRRAGRTARLSFRVDEAERLATLAEASFDRVLCVGALEHMSDQAAVLASVHRVLVPGGRFVCLTVNGGCLWYTTLAPFLGLDTRHLSTDHFLRAREAAALARGAGFTEVGTGWWSFVPRGDMPRPAAAAMTALDRLGAFLGIGAWRGGLLIGARKP